MTARTRQRLRRTLVYAGVLGLITNVLVAAWCVYRVSTRNKGLVYLGAWTAPDGKRYSVRLASVWGKAIAFWAPSRDPQEPPVPANVTPPAWTSTGHPGILARLSAEPPKREGHGYTRYGVRVDEAYGWLMLSFMSSSTADPDTLMLRPIDGGPGGGAAEPRTAPLIPIVPGLAANTALYAAFWWLGLVGLGTARLATRMRRGACLACGYDRSGIRADGPCPECGKGVAPPVGLRA